MSLTGQVTEKLEQALKIAGALAVLGYMSLRAHLNYLGISALDSLGLERYLAETYLLVLDAVLRLATLTAAASVAILPLGSLAALWMIFHPESVLARRVGLSLGKLARHPLTAVFVLTLLSGLALGLFASLQGPQDTVVGLLDPAKLGHRRAWRFDLVLAVLALEALLAPWIAKAAAPPSEGPTPQRTFQIWRLTLVPTALLVVALPLIYGHAAHRALFPLARVSFRNPQVPPLCGALVLSTEKSVTLWHATGGIATTTSVAMDEVERLDLGAVESLPLLAAQVAMGRDPQAIVPACDGGKPVL